MNRNTLAKRYLPLVAVVAIQLLIIALAPSKAPQEAELSSFGPGQGASDPFFEEEAAGEVLVDEEGNVIGGVTDGSGGGTTGGRTGGATTGGGGTTSGGGTTDGGGGSDGQPAGDTSHCVDGRQFDPKVYFFAPGCMPKFGGTNPGATYQGVTDKTIKVVKYNGKPNPAVDAIVDSLGGNAPDGEVSAFMKASIDFINKHFEFYGRQIEMVEVDGQCDTVPPNYVCLRGEMRDLVRTHKPFAVIWNTILASPAFDELSAQKVVNLGGWHFRDSFSQQRRPYHWDVAISGNNAAKQLAEWYCKRLHGKKAIYAGKTGTNPESENPPTNDIRNKTRVIGVISTDDPENEQNIKQVLKPELAKCGAKVEHEFYYAQDISRAEEQRQLGVAKMREEPESTTIMFFGDAVAPVFLYRTCQEQRYFPEHIVAGTGLMDSDAAAQAYDGSLNPGGHQFENAFGLSSIPKAEPFTDNDAARIWRAQGNKGHPFQSLTTDLQYYMLLGSLLQQAGPNLTPANIERGAFAAGFRGGAGDVNNEFINRRGFKPGQYSWNTDMRQVYWSPKTTSSFNGKAGSYVQYDGRRFELGQYPSGDVPIPDKPR